MSFLDRKFTFRPVIWKLLQWIVNVIHNDKRMLRLNLVFKLRGGVTTIAAVVLTVYLDSCLPASCANII